MKNRLPNWKETEFNQWNIKCCIGWSIKNIK